jgi:hypothetical protein
VRLGEFAKRTTSGTTDRERGSAMAMASSPSWIGVHRLPAMVTQDGEGTCRMGKRWCAGGLRRYRGVMGGVWFGGEKRRGRSGRGAG